MIRKSTCSLNDLTTVLGYFSDQLSTTQLHFISSNCLMPSDTRSYFFLLYFLAQFPTILPYFRNISNLVSFLFNRLLNWCLLWLGFIYWPFVTLFTTKHSPCNYSLYKIKATLNRINPLKWANFCNKPTHLVLDRNSILSMAKALLNWLICSWKIIVKTSRKTLLISFLEYPAILLT